MDQPAGKIQKEDASVTPWDAIDPEEPASGPAPLPHDEDADLVAVYRMEEPENAAPLNSSIARDDADARADEDNSALLKACSNPIVISPDAGELALPSKFAPFLLSEALEHPACPEPTPDEPTPHVGSSQASDAKSDDNLVEEPSVAVAADAPAGMEEPLIIESLAVGQNPEPPAIVVPFMRLVRDDAPTETLASNQNGQPAEQSSELFGNRFDALNDLPDTMNDLADVMDVVEESQPSVASVPEATSPQPPILQFRGPEFAQPEESQAIVPAPSVSHVDVVEPQVDSIAEVQQPPTEERFASHAPPVFEEESIEQDESDPRLEEALAEEVFVEDPDGVPEPLWEDPELDGELEPARSGGGWTIPMLCAGIGLIACCIVIPQADANRRLAYEKMTLTSDLQTIQKQVTVNDEFLKRVVDDPSLAERLAQRQLKRVRKGQLVLKMRDEKPEMSPFAITAVSPPPAPPAYRPLGGMIATTCYNARSRLYLMGIALIMIACGLVLGVAPLKSVSPQMDTHEHM